MPILNVDLMTPKGVVMEGVDIPDHLPCEELIASLVNTLALPRETVDGEPITYTLEIMNQGKMLQPGQTPGEAGAGNGDVIRLVSSRPIGGSEPKPATDLKEDKAQAVTISLQELLELLEKNREIGVKPVEEVVPSTSSASFFSKYRTAMLVILLLVGSTFLFLSPNKASQKGDDGIDSLPTPTPVASPTPIQANPTPPLETPTTTNSTEPLLRKVRVNPRKPQPVPTTVEKNADKKKCNFFKRAFGGGCKESKNAENVAKDKKSKQNDSSKKAPGFVKSTVKSSTQSAIQGTVSSSVHRVIR